MSDELGPHGIPRIVMVCKWCRGTRKVYPAHLRGQVALDTVPGYDPRIECPHCSEVSDER